MSLTVSWPKPTCLPTNLNFMKCYMKNESQDKLLFNPDSFAELKKLYAQAVKQGEKIFVFQEHELLTAYAKYLIESLEERFR